MQLIDSHCHLDDDRFDADREQVLQRAREHNISQIIIPATSANRWTKVRQISRQYEGVYASYGLHPMFMHEHQPDDLLQLDAWLGSEGALAVGECGLDFFHGREDEARQLALFRAQLSLALKHRLPVIIHARKALDLVLREIRKCGISRGVIHSFSGSLQQAQQLVELGFKLSISATISFERAKKLREIVQKVDINALLIESDAPDQPGQPHRGQRNEPAFIHEHLALMADIRGMPINLLADVLTQNTRDLFSTPPVF